MLSMLKKGTSRHFTELKNPDTIIIKNKYYPSGLTETDIHRYYFQNKQEILKETKNREVMLFLRAENQIVVRRNDREGDIARLTAKNYGDLVHPRIISIHSTMRKNETFGIVDIDIDDFAKAKAATSIVYQYLSKISTFKSVKIRYTGKESFHIFCYFSRSIPVNNIRVFLRKLLEPKFEGKYDIAAKRTAGKVNLDLSSNKYRGGFITLGSLSVWGLKCVEVPRGQLIRFDRKKVKIK